LAQPISNSPDIELANHLITLCGIEDRKTQAIRTLSKGERKQSSICNLLVSAIASNEPENYEQYYQKLSELYAKYELKTKREETLALLEPVAPMGGRDQKPRGYPRRCNLPANN
jgi:hypothetical protein